MTFSIQNYNSSSYPPKTFKQPSLGMQRFDDTMKPYINLQTAQRLATALNKLQFAYRGTASGSDVRLAPVDEVEGQAPVLEAVPEGQQ